MPRIVHCPHCDQTLECDFERAGPVVPCPCCLGNILAPSTAPATVIPADAPGLPSRRISRSRWLSPAIVVLATGAGAGLGWSASAWLPLLLVGGLLGFLVGRTVVGLVWPGERTVRMPAWFPSSHWSLALAVGSWGLVLGFAVLVYQAGWLRGEGASLLLLFFILPVATALGLIGGPTASLIARRALSQIQAGERPASEQRLARIALILSYLMSLTLAGFLLWLLVMIYG